MLMKGKAELANKNHLPGSGLDPDSLNFVNPDSSNFVDPDPHHWYIKKVFNVIFMQKAKYVTL